MSNLRLVLIAVFVLSLSKSNAFTTVFPSIATKAQTDIQVTEMPSTALILQPISTAVPKSTSKAKRFIGGADLASYIMEIPKEPQPTKQLYCFLFNGQKPVAM